MVEENPNLKKKNDWRFCRSGIVIRWKKEKEAFKKEKNARLDKFERKHPKAAKAIQNIRNSKITKNIGTSLKRTEATLITVGSVAVNSFLIGK